MSSKSSQLVNQEQALSVYLKDMLLLPADIESEQITTATTLNQVIEQTDAPIPDKDWRSSEFQALLFDVQGLKLAIPLHELSGILTWPEKALPKIPDKPSHYLGLYSQDPTYPSY
ncbi:MAG: hypothetical protein Q9N32_03975 [Gammaproteobacteria bacterium]|nr:hypothetical protein [Gammaproteobacteria bacterium]